MSAFIGLCRADRVEMMTDGSSIDPQNATLVALVDKAIALPGCSAAMTMRGNAKIIDIVQARFVDLFARAASFDLGIELLSDGIPILGADGGLPDDFPHFEVLIAGWSEANGPTLAYLISKSYKPHVKSCHLYTMTSGMNLCGIMRDDHIAGELDRRGGLAATGMYYMDGLRRMKKEPPFGKGIPRYSVGGHVDLTVVKADGVTTRRVHTWPDRIGERINPFAGSVVPIDGMNRQQRRAARHAA